MLGAKRALELTALGNHFTPIGHVVDERAVVNGVVGLHATGGSTNHTIHLIAMAAAAGIALTWEDFSDLAEVTPLLTRIYPNGKADVNHFQAAGGMGLLIRELSAPDSCMATSAPYGASGFPTMRSSPASAMTAQSSGLPRPSGRAIRRCCAAQTLRSSRPAACECSKVRSAGP